MKKIITTVMLLAILALVAVGVASCQPFEESFNTPVISITNGASTLFSNKSGAMTVNSYIDSGKLDIRNHAEFKVDVRVLYDSDGKRQEIKLSLEGGAASAAEVSEGSLWSVILEYSQENGGATTTVEYPATEEAFVKALSGEGESPFVVLCVDLKTNLLEVTRPLTLLLEKDLKVDTVYCHGDFDGKIVIDEEDGELECKEFFADGQGIVLDMPKLTYIEANPTYYLRVKIYNSRELDNSTITLTGIEEWEKLYSADSLPELYPNTTLIFKGKYVISSVISLDIPVNVEFYEGVTLEKPIKITVKEASTLSFKADRSAVLPDYPVDLDAESSNVLWEIPMNSGVDMYKIAKHLGALTVNGKAPESYALGGDGSARLTSVTLHATENRNITESIIWKLEGNVLRATVDCIADPTTLKNAKLTTVVTGGGKLEFDENVVTSSGGINLLAPGGCYATVTDPSGKTNRYLVETEYLPSSLPIVVIEVEGGVDVASNEEYQKATIYMTTDGTEYKALGESSIQIRGRGHSTWKWEKKPYKIKFDKKTSLFGLEANKDWTLLANYTDKALIRNYVAMEGAKLLSFAYTPSQFPVDVFVNGKYQGIYTMGEQLEAKNGRIELAEKGSEVDTGYLLEIGGTSSEDVWNETCFYTTLCKYVKVKAPDEETLTKDQVAYIREYVKKADAAVMAGQGYEEYIDLDALIDWVIVHELYYNIDCAFRRSCYFTKDAGGKLTMGPIWDFDNAFGNFWKDDKTYSTWATADSTSGYIWDNWMSYLISYPEFREKYRARWDEIKYDLLDKLLEAVDTGSELCSRSAAYNFQVWDILDRRVGCQDSSIKKYNTYEKQIDYMRSFIKTRWKWMDENI